jgi:hypothetical protein
MADIVLEALKAKHGDALLLSADGARVLIDGGPGQVYENVLRDRLVALDKGGDTPPTIDLMMISHIDDDHINGILDLTNELKEADEDGERRLVDIEEAWHNSFADTIAKTGVAKPIAARRDALSAASAVSADQFLGLHMVDSPLTLASVGQGRMLRSNLGALRIDVNEGFEDGIVLHDTATKPWRQGALTLTVIGPGRPELNKLRTQWAKQLPKILSKEAAKKADIQSAAKSLDRSVFNLASIVVVAEAGDKSALLTGDARGDMIVEWLHLAGRTDGKAHFDILKLPHHGSDRNVSAEFFAKVTADHYLISGNGNHGNPEPEALEMLFSARGDANYTVHMTYGPQEIAGHRNFHETGLLNKVLSKEPWRATKLSFPSGDETAVVIAV